MSKEKNKVILENNTSFAKIFYTLLLAMFLVTLFSLPGVYADLGVWRQNSCINIRVLSNCSSVNLVEVSNNKTFIINHAMTNIGGQTFNYTFCNTSILGIYTFSWNPNCQDCSQNNCGNSFTVTASGKQFQLLDIFVYLFFFLMCLTITYLSISLIKNNTFSKDEVKGKDLYEMKKRNNFLYYMQLLKQKSWIIGWFGVYLSLLIFIILLDQLVFNLGLVDLDSFLQYAVIGSLWGLIPFTIFWFIYLIIVFYTSTVETFRYQLGSFKS